MSKEYIGFSEIKLEGQPLRLEVIEKGLGWIALNKGKGVVLVPEKGVPLENAITKVLNEQIKAKKQSLLARGMQCAKTIYDLDTEVSGVALIGTQPEIAGELRNKYGSESMGFRFKFLTRGSGLGKKGELRNEIICDLPLAEHTQENRMLVSHKTGKKTLTIFKKIEILGPFSLWEAQAWYLRKHQIRLHAAEVGLPIIGEDIYAYEEQIFLSDLKFLNKRPEKEEPICPGLVLHLETVELNSEKNKSTQSSQNEKSSENKIVITAELRPQFQVLLNKLRDRYDV